MPTQRLADPYATLGVARGATPGQVRAAYRRLAKRYHPDVHADARATEQMRRINQAWEILSSAARRAQHDADLASQAAASGFGHWSGVPRRAQPAAASPPRAAHEGPRAYYGGAPAYRDGRAYAGAYRGAGSDEKPGFRLGALLLIVPVAVFSVAILSAGVLPFPVLGILLVILVSSIGRRDG